MNQIPKNYHHLSKLTHYIKYMADKRVPTWQDKMEEQTTLSSGMSNWLAAAKSFMFTSFSLTLSTYMNLRRVVKVESWMSGSSNVDWPLFLWNMVWNTLDLAARTNLWHRISTTDMESTEFWSSACPGFKMRSVETKDLRQAASNWDGNKFPKIWKRKTCLVRVRLKYL